jgi:hypothetical protein
MIIMLILSVLTPVNSITVKGFIGNGMKLDSNKVIVYDTGYFNQRIHGKIDSSAFANKADTVFKIYDSTGALLIKGLSAKLNIYANLFFDTTEPTNGLIKYGSAKALYLSTGGYPSADSGAWIQLYGNNYPDYAGNLTLSSGNSGIINLYSSGAINSHGYYNYYFTEDTLPQISFGYGVNEVTMRAFNQHEQSPSHSLNFVLGLSASEDVHGMSIQQEQIIFRDTVIYLKGFKGGTTGGSTDSTRASHKADRADSAGVSGTSYGFIHGVPAGVLLKAKSASACTSSHVSENGDTVKITYTSAPGDTFTNSGLTPGVMYSGCSAPNGDCYFSVNYGVFAGDIFIQYAGAGVLNDLNQTHLTYKGMTSTSNGDVYACVWSGNLYKRTGGTGDFVSIGLSDYWYDITQFDDQLFAVDGDSIYQIDPVSLVKTNLNQTVRQYVKIHATKNGDIYVLVAGTQDIYRRAFGTSTFVALGQTNRAWTAISSDTSGNVYAASGGGYYNCYRQMGGVGDFVLFQPLNTSCYHYFSKINGDMYGLMSNRITIKTNEITDRIFNVSGGNSNFAGKVNIENTPTTTTAAWVLGKNAAPDNEIKKIDLDTLRTVIGAATPQQISDSLANKVIGVGTRYFMPVWSGTPTTHTLSNSSLLNLGSALMNIGVASSMQLINTSESESSCNLIFNNADTKYYGGGVYLTYHKIQNDSGYSHFEIRSYSSAGKYLTFLRIDEQGGLNLNHADYDDTRSIPAMTVDNGGIHINDTIWTDIGTSKCLSMFNSDGAIINSGISDSGNVLSFLDSISIHLRNWSSGTGYFLIGDQSIDSGSYFKMYNKVSGGNTVIQNKNGIGLLTPGSYVVAEDDFHTQYNEEGVAYVNGAKSLRTITAIDSNELKVLDGAVDTFTVVDSLFDGGTFRTASTVAVYKIGKMVTVSFCDLIGTVTADTNTYVKFGSNLPSATDANSVQPHIITNNGGQVKMGWLYNAGARKYQVYNYDNSKLAAGTSGIKSATYTYIAN